jgi:hypothetical protein
MLISGLVTYLAYHSPNVTLRGYLAGGVMLGFLSHLVLDELCSVDLMGVTIRLNKYAGSAVKLFSPSWPATLACYLMLGGLGWLTWQDWSRESGRNRWTSPRPAVSVTTRGDWVLPAGNR